jgi:hypothetical protein
MELSYSQRVVFFCIIFNKYFFLSIFFNIFIKYSEDVARFRSAEQNQEFLLHRINALENHINFLEARLEIADKENALTLKTNN